MIYLNSLELLRRLPNSGEKIKIEASVLLGDEDEAVEVRGKSDCWDFGNAVTNVWAIDFMRDTLHDGRLSRRSMCLLKETLKACALKLADRFQVFG